MARNYVVAAEELESRPQVRFGDKVYAVDNRLRTFEAIGAELKEGGDALRAVLSNALGAGAYEEIAAANPPYPALSRLATLVMAAMQDISEEDAVARFQGR